MDAEKMIKDAIDKNSDLRLVLEIAARAREAESKEPPRTIGMATEITSIPVSSASLAPLGTPPVG
jgi:hypothetical protein